VVINSPKINKIYSNIYTELKRAMTIHPEPMHNAHEGFAVLLEEVDELWNAVKMKESPERNTKINEEAEHVAVIAIRLLYEVDVK